MTKTNDTALRLNDQINKVRKCSDALRDIYLNIPEEDRYACVLSVVGERLKVEVDALQVLCLTSLPSEEP